MVARRFLFPALALVVVLGIAMAACVPKEEKTRIPEGASYMGSKTCAECHEEAYEKYIGHAEKARSFAEKVVAKGSMFGEDRLRSCFPCHTTGFRKSGGFMSISETPDLDHVGCESCHGPGSAHVEAGGGPGLIERRINRMKCESCHGSGSDIREENFQLLLFGGKH